MENAQPLQHTVVMKFGGTSVGSYESMKSAVRLIVDTKRDHPNLVVVTSAISGATNRLIQSALDAANGDITTAEKTVHELTERHHKLIDQFVDDPNQWLELKMQINRLLSDFSGLCNAIRILGELSPRALDAVSSLGERLAVRVLAAAVNAAGCPSTFVESSQLIITDEVFQNALPNMERTKKCCKRILSPILAEGKVPIVTGFMGATESGAITTLGRGGSDYSASIVAVGLDADEVWIWTDVTGVMTTDPRIIPEARTIPVLSFNEVSEMAFYGAKVLHPRSIRPCVENGIRMRICNTFHPELTGTILVNDVDPADEGKIKAVTSSSDYQLVTVSGSSMDGVMGISSKIFAGFSQNGITIPMVIESSSEQALCIPVPVKEVGKVRGILDSALESEIRRGDIQSIEVSDPVDILTVISSGLKKNPTAIAKVFAIIVENGIRLRAMSYGASDVSLNLIVNAQDTEKAIRAIHEQIS